MKLYIGNISKKASVTELFDLLSPYGCEDCVLHYDRVAARPVGYCMAVVKDGLRALREINGKIFHGQELKVAEAVNREQAIAS